MGKKGRGDGNRIITKLHFRIQDIGLNSKYWRIPLILVPFAFFFRMLLPNSQYYIDWVNSYWMLLSAHGAYPQLTLSPSGFPPLTPWYPYYGGGLYNLLNVLSNNPLARLFGLNTIDVYRWSYLLFAIGFTIGWYILARAFNIPRFFSMMISTAATASPYFLTNAYGRGDFSEFAAISSIGILFGGVALVLKSPEESRRHKNVEQNILGILAVYFGSYVLVTAHTLTLILFTTFILIASISAIPSLIKSHVFVLQFIRQRSRRLLLLLFALILSFIAAFPFLLNLLRTGRSTVIAEFTPEAALYPEISSFLEIFKPYPHVVPRGTPNLDAQVAAPLAIALCVILLNNLNLFYNIQRLSVLVACFLVTAISIGIACVDSIFKVLPTILRAMQYPYRFVTYVTFSIMILAIFVLHILHIERKLFTFPVVFLCFFVFVMSVASGIFQVSTAIRYDNKYPPMTTLSAKSLPQTWYASATSYATVGPFAPSTTEADVVAVTSPHDGAIEYTIRCHSELAVQFPLYLVPPLGKISGMVLLGTTTDGFVVGSLTNCKEGDYRSVKFEEVRSVANVPFKTFPLASLAILILLLFSILRKRNICENKV